MLVKGLVLGKPDIWSIKLRHELLPLMSWNEEFGDGIIRKNCVNTQKNF